MPASGADLFRLRPLSPWSAGGQDISTRGVRPFAVSYLPAFNANAPLTLIARTACRARQPCRNSRNSARLLFIASADRARSNEGAQRGEDWGRGSGRWVDGRWGSGRWDEGGDWRRNRSSPRSAGGARRGDDWGKGTAAEGRNWAGRRWGGAEDWGSGRVGGGGGRSEGGRNGRAEWERGGPWRANWAGHSEGSRNEGGRMPPRCCHPDVSRHHQSTQAFRAILAAYEVLSDEQQRQRFDFTLPPAAAAAVAGATTDTRPFWNQHRRPSAGAATSAAAAPSYSSATPPDGPGLVAWFLGGVRGLVLVVGLSAVQWVAGPMFCHRTAALVAVVVWLGGQCARRPYSVLPLGRHSAAAKVTATCDLAGSGGEWAAAGGGEEGNEGEEGGKAQGSHLFDVERCWGEYWDEGRKRVFPVRRLLPLRSAPGDSAGITAREDAPLIFNEVEYSPDGLAVVKADPLLASHEPHLRYRYAQFLKLKRALEQHEGGLEQFSRGYETMGFTREKDAIVYREWAPAATAAQLVGDFNGWNGESCWMERNHFGVWSVRLPDRDGRPAIAHGSRVKIRLQKGDGGWVERIPAWIKWATAEPGKMGACYDGIYWDPPANEKYQFKCPRPPKPDAPRIYEAHVGMSSEEPRVASYVEFANSVLPRIKAAGYNTIQLMAVAEHSYYASFGYHVTNFFAVSSRSGTPEDLKYLVDTAHSLGIRVFMDLIHSHASNNASDGLNGFDFGQSAADSYFHTGERGYHRLWDSRCFNYSNWEVLRFLLSNLRYWLEEFQFDGFRFDGVTSMLYHHRGIGMSFSGDYHEYFSTSTDVDAVVYLMLANDLIHGVRPDATTIAEDVSGMPTLGLPVPIGGVGFDYRLAMAIPDRWIEYLKDRRDEEWSMREIVHTLTNRRYTEKCVAYAESHDQSMVGDKSFAFLLMDSDMYFHMSVLEKATPAVERGVALHKMIHFITMALGGDGYLNFMGNEFGHPEWLDFPREGNNWSYDRCRRMWHLRDDKLLRYQHMNRFDRAMNALDEKYHFLAADHQIVSSADEKDRVIVFERGDLLFVFNFHPTKTYEGYKVGCKEPGKWRVVLDSDAIEFGGQGRVGHDVDHFTSPEGIPGRPETNFNNRCCSLLVLSPPRTCQVYARVKEDEPPSTKPPAKSAFKFIVPPSPLQLK
ncbi:unnamed protein product [Closterium sp. Naga37s-1]|nr:unnamed protein product [Closterium sp. Naga37s-1]